MNGHQRVWLFLVFAGYAADTLTELADETSWVWFSLGVLFVGGLVWSAICVCRNRLPLED